MRTPPTTGPALAIALALFFGCPAIATNRLANASFETPVVSQTDHFQVFTAGQFIGEGWRVGLGDDRAVLYDSERGSGFPTPPHGRQALLVGENGRSGYVTQTAVLSHGVYRMSFQYANVGLPCEILLRLYDQYGESAIGAAPMIFSSDDGAWHRAEFTVVARNPVAYTLYLMQPQGRASVVDDFDLSLLPERCTQGWLARDAGSGVNETIRAMTSWDPDGPCPRTEVLVVGGDFTIAGGIAANRVAAYDPVTGLWSALGAGFNSRVWALTTLPNGDIIAGGSFRSSGGVPVNGVARWDGVSWTSMGSGMNYFVYSLTTRPNGDVVAGGFFSSAGGVPANNIALWDGTSWSALGSGMGDPNSNLSALATLPNGDVVAAGRFRSAGGVPANNIALWNGVSWSALGSGVSRDVYSLSALPDGGVVVGGWLQNAGSVAVRNIARWNGMSWSALGGGVESEFYALITLPNGDLVAAADAVGGPVGTGFSRWDGSAWYETWGGVSGRIYALSQLRNGNLAAAGFFTTAGAQSSPSLAQYTFGGTFAIITSQPASAQTGPFGSVPFSVAVTSESVPAFRWQLLTSSSPGDWTDFTPAPRTISCGATAAATNPHETNTRIAITACPGSPAAPQHVRIRCAVSTTCGIVYSNEATYTVCPADFDSSGAIGVQDLFDVLAAFFSGDLRADFDGSGTTGLQDILTYLTAYFTGCA